ncbi:MAG: transposase [Nitrososphaera sp.]|nr:transposase [Nitrososphaera sp.]
MSSLAASLATTYCAKGLLIGTAISCCYRHKRKWCSEARWQGVGFCRRKCACLLLTVDEALERKIYPMRAGQIERQEFEYERHGTVNFLVELVVHTGKMRGWCLEKNDSEHLCWVLPKLFRYHRSARRIHLIWDNGPSHISGDTRELLNAYYPWVRVLLTPPHASWLNQAELLLRAFKAHYLGRGSWDSRESLIDHLNVSWPEYNRLFAHPFTWSWTRYRMHKWMDDQLQ